MNLRTQIVTNTLSNGLKVLVSLGINLIIPPFLIAHLGVEIYGIWALLVAVSTLVYLFDLGLQPALMKYVAEAYTNGDINQINRYANTVIIFYLFGGILSVIIVWISTPLIISIYFNSAATIPYIKALIITFATLTALSMLSDALQNVLNGIQRMDEANIISVMALIIQTVCLVLFLIMGWQLWGIVASIVVGLIVKLTGTWVRLYSCLLDIKITIFYQPQWIDFKRLINLSSSGIAVRIGGTITGQLNKFLIGYFAGLSWVAYYDLAARVLGQFGVIASIMFSPLVPSVSQLSALNNRNLIHSLTERSLKYLNLFSLPIFWFILLFANGLITAWLGPRFEVVALTLQVLIISHYINLLSGPAFHTLIGLGKPRLGIWSAVINTALFSVCSLVGGYMFGYWGIVASEFIAVTTGGLFLTIMFYRTEKLPFLHNIWNKLVMPSMLIVVSTFFLVLLQRILSVDIVNQHLWAWAVQFTIYCAATAGLYRLTGLVGTYEWTIVKGILQRLSPINGKS